MAQNRLSSKASARRACASRTGGGGCAVRSNHRLGLAVDDTIHFITHCRSEFARSGDYRLAIQETFRTVGKSIFMTSFIRPDCRLFPDTGTGDVDKTVWEKAEMKMSSTLSGFLSLTGLKTKTGNS